MVWSWKKYTTFFTISTGESVGVLSRIVCRSIWVWKHSFFANIKNVFKTHFRVIYRFNYNRTYVYGSFVPLRQIDIDFFGDDIHNGKIKTDILSITRKNITEFDELTAEQI